MGKNKLSFFFLAIILSFYAMTKGHAQTDRSDRQTLISMRLIGHEVLLSAGDSTARVLPIKKEVDSYKIEFDTEFTFEPVLLVGTIDSILDLSNLSDHYIVEVVQCKTEEIVYAYQIGGTDYPDMLPCGRRELPEDCYALFMTFPESSAHETVESFAAEPGVNDSNKASTKGYVSTLTPLISLLLIAGLAMYFFRKKNKPAAVATHIISIGKYQFDKLNMMLSLGEEKVELSGKETDLLHMLYRSANNTIKREDILRTVWEDEGDYVGRTLDVFISKLRKKLEADSSVKIINIRGVGYKLILNT